MFKVIALFHHAFLTMTLRPLHNAYFCSSSRKAKNLTTGLYRIFRGLNFEPDAKIGPKEGLCKGLTLLLIIWVFPFAIPQEVDAKIVPLNMGELHHLEKTTRDSYVITGEDPYLVYRRKNTNQHFEGIYFQIDPDLNIGCQYQLFWQAMGLGFSEHRSVRVGDNTKISTKAFYLPMGGIDQSVPITGVRIDFENCKRKTVRISDISFRSEEDIVKSSTVMISEDKVMPILPMVVKPHIRDKGPWVINDMTTLGEGQYEIVGDDPYIISPKLNVPLNMARGVYYKLRLLNNDSKVKLQLFWSTYSKGYNTKDNFVFWDTAGNDEIFEFFIPFTNLPKNQLLRTLRLDFPACEKCTVEMLDARIVTKETDTMTQSVPNLITYRLWNSVFETYIPRDIVKRLFQDPLFFIFHLILLVITTVALVWIGLIRGDRKDCNE